MTQSTENGTIFFCDNCDEVIEGSEAAEIHYNMCTMHDSESENVHASSPAKSDERELLISEVFCREPLWNTLLPYTERSYKITSALWHEIDIALGVQNGYSQKTFKSLRDRFVRLLGEEYKSKRSGSAASSKVDWKYFEQLNFLRPSVEYRPTTSSLSKSKRSIDTNIDRMSSSLSKSTRSIDTDMETSKANCSSVPKKKNKSVQPLGSVTEDFESYCKKYFKPTVPDRIGSFILYLESEMRTLSNQAMKKLIRKITEALMQIQDES